MVQNEVFLLLNLIRCCLFVPISVCWPLIFHFQGIFFSHTFAVTFMHHACLGIIKFPLSLLESPAGKNNASLTGKILHWQLNIFSYFENDFLDQIWRRLVKILDYSQDYLSRRSSSTRSPRNSWWAIGLFGNCLRDVC